MLFLFFLCLAHRISLFLFRSILKLFRNCVIVIVIDVACCLHHYFFPSSFCTYLYWFDSLLMLSFIMSLNRFRFYKNIWSPINPINMQINFTKIYYIDLRTFDHFHCKTAESISQHLKNVWIKTTQYIEEFYFYIINLHRFFYQWN